MQRSCQTLFSFTSVMALLVLLGGCSGWLGESKESPPLEGTRIAVREIKSDETITAPAQYLPPQRNNAQWQQNNGNSTRSLDHPATGSILTPSWTANAGNAATDESRITATPIVTSNKVLTLDAAAQVTAFETVSGQMLWQVNLTPEGEDGRDGFGGGLGAAGNYIFVSTGFGEVLALDAESGTIIWRTPVGAPVRSAPAIAGEKVFVVTRDDRAIAIDAQTGREIWDYRSRDSSAGFLGGASPAAAGQVVIVPFGSGEIIALHAPTGRRIWNGILGSGPRGSALSGIVDVTGDPVIAQGRVIVGNLAGRLAAFDGRNGRRIWARNIGIYNPVWAGGDMLFIVTASAQVMALRSSDGATIWTQQLTAFQDSENRTGGISYGGPILAGGRVLLTSSDGKLYQLEPQSGEILKTINLGASATTAPIVAGGKVYILTDDAILRRFQ